MITASLAEIYCQSETNHIRTHTKWPWLTHPLCSIKLHNEHSMLNDFLSAYFVPVRPAKHQTCFVCQNVNKFTQNLLETLFDTSLLGLFDFLLCPPVCLRTQFSLMNWRTGIQLSCWQWWPYVATGCCFTWNVSFTNSFQKELKYFEHSYLRAEIFFQVKWFQREELHALKSIFQRSFFQNKNESEYWLLLVVSIVFLFSDLIIHFDEMNLLKINGLIQNLTNIKPQIYIRYIRFMLFLRYT